MTTHIQKLIARSVAQIESDPQHHLPLFLRQELCNSLGPTCTPLSSSCLGYRNRAKLAIKVVQKVAPLWKSTWPQDETVEILLSDIKHCIETRESLSTDLYHQKVQSLWEEITERTNQTREKAGIVGMAAVAAYSVALWDNYAQDDQLDEKELDSTDFMLGDVHFYAAAAFAGGPPYEISIAPSSNKEKRKEFWLWWLEEVTQSSQQKV